MGFWGLMWLASLFQMRRNEQGRLDLQSAAEGGMSMSLEEYKHEIETMLLEASMKLTCAEYEELTDWLREEGLV